MTLFPATKVPRKRRAGGDLRRPPAVVRALALVLAASTAVAWPVASSAQVGGLQQVLQAAAEAARRSRELAGRMGDGYQREALAAVRRSCAARGVVRLDETVPTEAQASVAGPGEVLLELRLGASPGGDAKMEAATEETVLESAQNGLVLKAGQVRTVADFALARDEVGSIELEIATSAPGHVLLGWSDEVDAPRLRRNNARVELVGDGRTRTYTIDAGAALVRGLEAGGSVRRFFVASRSAAPVTLVSLRALSRLHRYTHASWGTAHERRGAELRSVLWAHAPASLSFDVDVPAQSPVLEAGLGLVATDGVVEFEAAVRDGEATTVLMKRLVRAAPWEDVSLDLAPFAGRRVQLVLSMRGSRDAVALWSSPLVRPRLADDKTEPFLVVVEDALRADRLDLYGGPIASPAHARVAAGGAVLDRAFAQATQTRSSVPSMMTSLLPSANGTWDFSDALAERYVTLAEALRACGFATGSFVQNGNAGAYAGLAQGFDVLFDEESFGPRAADILGAASPLDAWISRQRGRPWFAYVHVLDPHGPFDPADRPDLAAPGEGEAIARDRSIDAEWLEVPTAAARRTLYDAEVVANDAALGGFLDRLEARGDLARATLLVTADHGEFLGEHGGLWRHHPPAHFEVARVPLLLRAPGAPARRVGEAVGLLDVMPTLLDLAGADASALVMHGRSLAPVLRGHSLPDRAVPAEEMLLDLGDRRASACGSFATGERLWLLSCTRDEDWEPGRALPSRGPTAPPLRVFDLAPTAAPVEVEPGTVSAVVVEGLARRALRTMQEAGLEAWKAATEGMTERVTSEPRQAERLRALGYVD